MNLATTRNAPLRGAKDTLAEIMPFPEPFHLPCSAITPQVTMQFGRGGVVQVVQFAWHLYTSLRWRVFPYTKKRRPDCGYFA